MVATNMKGKVLIVVTIIIAVICGNYFYSDVNPPKMRDGWFGRGPEVNKDESIRPFKVDVSEDVLLDLHERLDNVRLGEDLENTQFQYGFQVSYMKKILEHWKTNFNWRKQEAELNRYQQFITNIEGIDVHFIHAKPTKPTKRVLLLVHGWPGSVWEFYKILPMLTDPASRGGRQEDAMEVICPSIPGFGFSEAPHQTGFSPIAAARVFQKLMTRLGHDKFYVQGGDWGFVIVTLMAQAYPQQVLGLHINLFFQAIPSPIGALKLIVGNFAPSLVGITPEQYSRFFPLSKSVTFMLRELGYFHLQTTRPDTAAFGLNDSPVGLAAYILEKFSVWTNMEYINKDDGGLTEKFTLDELLTNVMVYWVTGTIGSSMRLYKEFEAFDSSSEINSWDKMPVPVPTGFADFPNEIYSSARPIIETKYGNIIQFSTMERGGHFPAFEEPRLLADDLLLFIRKVEQQNEKP